MDPEFRKATLDDMAVLLEYMQEYYVFDNLEINEGPAREALSNLISDPSLGSVWLVYSAGEAVGYVVLTYGFSLEFGGRDAFIDELFIQESHRGRGVGTQTIEFVVSEAKSAGVNAVHLEVAHRNEGARRVYRSLGFEERERFMLMSKFIQKFRSKRRRYPILPARAGVAHAKLVAEHRRPVSSCKPGNPLKHCPDNQTQELGENNPVSYEHIVVETRGPVGLATLNRPEALNALSGGLMSELADALDNFEEDNGIGAMVIAGGEKAFAAGADIKEMKDQSYTDAYLGDFVTAQWERVTTCRKPVIAAVGGYALGGGCELAMMCDFIIAGDNAKFGQPEINLGILPGAGGTQRLTRFVGKSKAMEMCLTGRMMDAEEAERAGLVSRVVPAAELLEEAIKTATKIAELSRPAVIMTKESVNRAYETTLAEGVRFERRLFHAAFAMEDQKEGMSAFAEKRTPVWKHR